MSDDTQTPTAAHARTATAAELVAMLDSANPNDRRNAARDERCPQDALRERIIGSVHSSGPTAGGYPDAQLARGAALNPRSDAELLSTLAHHVDAAVRDAVAQHPDTAELTLSRLAGDSVVAVQVAVADHTATPPIALSRLAAEALSEADASGHDGDDTWIDLAVNVAANPSTDPADVGELLALGNPTIIDAILAAPHTGSGTIRSVAHMLGVRWLHDGHGSAADWRHARAVLDHPNATPDSVSTIARALAAAPDDVSPIFLGIPRDDLDGPVLTGLLEATVLRADALSAAAAWLAAHPDLDDAGVAALENSADPRLHRIAYKHRSHAADRATNLPAEAAVPDSGSDEPVPVAPARSIGL